MTRKDTILIAVVINAGLLAILFTTAVIYDTDGGNEQIEFVTPVVDNKTVSSEPPPTLIAAAATGDEVDNVLKYYHPSVSQPMAVPRQSDVYVPEPIVEQSNAGDDEDLAYLQLSPPQERFIELTVKRGDVLEKIARAHKTTVGAIKRANQLDSERLSIGQVLKIPIKQDSSIYAAATVVQSERKAEAKIESPKDHKATEPVYYVVKSGDNPWKIAKQFGIKYDEVLRLNNLDEEKARNLKIGDRIRVK
jgi:peptidoglycan endopeptidase LytF